MNVYHICISRMHSIQWNICYVSWIQNPISIGFLATVLSTNFELTCAMHTKYQKCNNCYQTLRMPQGQA